MIPLRRPAWLLALAGARAGWGAALLLAPRRVLPLAGGAAADDADARVARVLGLRQIIQAAVIVARPRARAQLAGAAVDALHAASMIGLGRWGRRRTHRQLAQRDSKVAGVLALTGVASAVGCGRADGELISSFPGC